MISASAPFDKLREAPHFIRANPTMRLPELVEGGARSVRT